MQVIASRNHKKGHIIYHRSRCIYEKRIHPDNKWSMDLEKAQKSKQKKYYRQAEKQVRRKAIRKIDKLFAKLKANNPELKALSFC